MYLDSSAQSCVTETIFEPRWNICLAISRRIKEIKERFVIYRSIDFSFFLSVFVISRYAAFESEYADTPHFGDQKISDVTMISASRKRRRGGAAVAPKWERVSRRPFIYAHNRGLRGHFAFVCKWTFRARAIYSVLLNVYAVKYARRTRVHTRAPKCISARAPPLQLRRAGDARAWRYK